MLNTFAKQLKERGFRVWIPRSHADNPTWIVAAIDGHLGMVSEALGVGYAYTTMHVPCLSAGSGFRFSEGGLNVGTMAECCRCFIPQNFPQSYKIRKWNVEDWAARNADRYVEISN